MRSVQVSLGIMASGLVFLVFYTTRDVMLRSRSLFFQISSILLVAALPVVGFLIYVLVRPSQTIKTRKLEQSISSLVSILREQQMHEGVSLLAEAKKKLSEINMKVQEGAKKNEETSSKKEKIVPKIPATATS